ncbi:MAG: ABC transporter permease subunit [Arhodomonas sp.]|nr:ABC transporter permease subunit [Arhodomonas sp.]
MEFDFSVIPQAIPELLAGARLTLYITVTGLLGGFFIGVVAGTARAYGNRLLNAVAMTYIELIRGTPIVVQVMFIYFAMPILLDMRLDALTSAIAAIVINAGAYIAEIVRGSLLSIEPRLHRGRQGPGDHQLAAVPRHHRPPGLSPAGATAGQPVHHQP